MNHHHRKVLHGIFSHPISANIAMKDVEAVLRELGAETSHGHNGKLTVSLKGHTASFSHAQHSLPKQEVQQVRKFLEGAGVDPERDYPL